MIKIFNNIEEFLCAVMLLFITTIAFANVLVRYLTNGSLAFTEELIINLFVWITVFGGAIAFKRNAHLGVTLLTNMFPKKYQKIFLVFASLCSVALFILLFTHGYKLVASEYINKMTTYSIGLPMWWFGMAIPVGAIFLIIRVIEATWKELQLLSEADKDTRMGGQ